MNVLIAVGTSAAYFYSVIATFFPTLVMVGGEMPNTYYDTSAMIIALILLRQAAGSPCQRADLGGDPQVDGPEGEDCMGGPGRPRGGPARRGRQSRRYHRRSGQAKRYRWTVSSEGYSSVDESDSSPASRYPPLKSGRQRDRRHHQQDRLLQVQGDQGRPRYSIIANHKNGRGGAG